MSFQIRAFPASLNATMVSSKTVPSCFTPTPESAVPSVTTFKIKANNNACSDQGSFEIVEFKDGAATEGSFFFYFRNVPGRIPKADSASAWGTTPTKLSSGVNDFFVVYDPLEYDNPIVSVTSSPIPEPDFSKLTLFGVSLGGSAGNAEPPAPGSSAAATTVYMEAKDYSKQTNRVSDSRCSKARLVLACTIKNYYAAVSAYNHVIANDSNQVMALFKAKNGGDGEITPFILGPSGFDTALRKLYATSGATVDLQMKDQFSRLEAEGASIRERLGLRGAQSVKDVLNGSDPGCAPVEKPFIELTAGCGRILSDEAAALRDALDHEPRLTPSQRAGLALAISSDRIAPTLEYESLLNRAQDWEHRLSNAGRTILYDHTGLARCSGAAKRVLNWSATSTTLENPFDPLSKVEVADVTCNPPWVASAGFGFSSLPTVTFPVVPFVGPIGTTYTLERVSDSGRLVGAALASRCICANPGDKANAYLSFGLGYSQANVAQLIAGPSFGFPGRAFLFTLGANYGAVSTLANGSNPLGPVPVSYTPQTINSYRIGIAGVLTFAVSPH